MTVCLSPDKDFKRETQLQVDGEGFSTEKGRGLMFFISVFFPGIIKGPDQSEKTSVPGWEGGSLPTLILPTGLVAEKEGTS